MQPPRFEKFDLSKANKLVHELQHIKTKLLSLGLNLSYNRVDLAIKQLQSEMSSARTFHIRKARDEQQKKSDKK
jgi:hypothetical protein